MFTLHHLAILTDDMDAALAFWRDALGLQVSEQREVPAEAAEIAFLPLGDSEIELVRPTTDDSGLARYLSKRGAGMHHVCLEVSGLEAVMQRLQAHGVRMGGVTPSSTHAPPAGCWWNCTKRRTNPLNTGNIWQR